jgi:hypothetical protein
VHCTILEIRISHLRRTEFQFSWQMVFAE